MIPATFPAASFWERVERTANCWQWSGRTHQGYGVVMHGRRNYRAHRVAWFLSGRTIPEGLVLDHLCRNRACVNPAHLEPVTPRENVMRGVGPAARNADKTHCPEGHPFAGENLLMRGDWRRCRTCENARRNRLRGRRAACSVCGAVMRQGSLGRHVTDMHAEVSA